MDKCKCDLRTKLVGDGCQHCNPQITIDSLNDEIQTLRAKVELLVEALRLENFAADSWANAFYNAFQYIKNIRDGISSFDSAISNLELCEKDCQANWAKANTTESLATYDKLSEVKHDTK